MINETISDRVAKGKHEYELFLVKLEWTTGEDGSKTYGQSLAKGLESTQTGAHHTEKIRHLKTKLNFEESHIMNSLIDILDKDEHLCNVLNTPPGRKWLSDKMYREEMRVTYEEIDLPVEAAAPDSETKKRPSPARDFGVGPSKDLEDILPGLRRMDVPGGEFQMGSKDGGDDEKPVHPVKLGDFKISATPVTQAQYEAVMGVNPSKFQGMKLGAIERALRDVLPDTPAHKAERPVENVSWNDAMVFCERLTKLAEGKMKVTLPTEAQWEYAARGGGESKGYTYAGSDDLDEVGWYDDNSNTETHPVKTKKANELGLYDMSGNVWEWCRDKWHSNYEGAPTDGSAWETGGSSDRVLRGGSWDFLAGDCRSANRGRGTPDYRRDSVGFRLVFVP